MAIRKQPAHLEHAISYESGERLLSAVPVSDAAARWVSSGGYGVVHDSQRFPSLCELA